MRKNACGLLVLLMSVCTQVYAQAYKVEVGLSLGQSAYMGDANMHEWFASPELSYGLVGRYALNGRFALRAEANNARVSGSVETDPSVFLNGRTLTFDRSVQDVGVLLEMNFYEYGMPEYVQGSSWISPYVSIGVGVSSYQTNQRKWAFSIPFGVGVKAKVLPRLNANLDWTWRRLSSDDLDAAEPFDAFQLSHPMGVDGVGGKNSDWYSVLSLRLTFDLFAAGTKCCYN